MLNDYLTANEITEAEFAELIGRNQSSINRLRNGISRPDWETARRIAAATNGAVTPNDFLDDSPAPFLPATSAPAVEPTGPSVPSALGPDVADAGQLASVAKGVSL